MRYGGPNASVRNIRRNLLQTIGERLLHLLSIRNKWRGDWLHQPANGIPAAPRRTDMRDYGIGGTVRSDRRSQGIGRCLFNAAYNEAKAQGCLQIEVCCNQLRLRTHRFYEVCGMHNFHYKFSLSLTQTGDYDNKLGR